MDSNLSFTINYHCVPAWQRSFSVNGFLLYICVFSALILINSCLCRLVRIYSLAFISRKSILLMQTQLHTTNCVNRQTDFRPYIVDQREYLPRGPCLLQCLLNLQNIYLVYYPSLVTCSLLYTYGLRCLVYLVYCTSSSTLSVSTHFVICTYLSTQW